MKRGLEMADAPAPAKSQQALAAKPSYTVTNLDTLFDENPEQQAALDAADQAAKGGGELGPMDLARFKTVNHTRLKQDAQIVRQRRINLFFGAVFLVAIVCFLAMLGATLFTKQTPSTQPPPQANVTRNTFIDDDREEDAQARRDSEEEGVIRATIEANSTIPVPLEDEETVPAAEGTADGSTSPLETVPGA